MKTPRARTRRRASRHRAENVSDPTAPSIQRQLQAARSQLTLYAKDLKELLAREEKKSRQLGRVNQQLLAYARDLKTAFDTEQQKTSRTRTSVYWYCGAFVAGFPLQR